MHHTPTLLRLCLAGLLFVCPASSSFAQAPFASTGSRNSSSLNGKWNVVIDPFDIGKGQWAAIWKDRKPQGKTDFFEYSFDEGPLLDVPGDFNSQLPELNYFESSVWYKKTFQVVKKPGRRLFIHFGAVNYKADVYINSQKAGSHEGGFTPFQFEITGLVKDGLNSVIVRANSQRVKDGIPGAGFDWFNYGGITRDVTLVETAASFIEDYFLQLQKGSFKNVKGWVKLSDSLASRNVRIEIPELKIRHRVKTNSEGIAMIEFAAPFSLWSPQHPKLYSVNIISDTDSLSEEIGFRSIEVKGTDILLNGNSIFLKGVNIHEEMPLRKGRAWSESDARILLGWAKDLGCNFVRLAHYPHNEHMVKLAEKMGLMVWEEIPVYQSIEFADAAMQEKMNRMLKEMVNRDKNRCATIIWSLSNETRPSPERNAALRKMFLQCREMDNTRLITSAFDHNRYQDNKIIIEDSLNELMDIISVNEYLGWYRPWPAAPADMQWESGFNKPLIMSEFGAEAVFGNTAGPTDKASSWSEEYMAQVYRDQLTMLRKIPYLRGTCPWILADFRSPNRMHPVFQQGWNRKGLLSDRGEKKKAWYVMEQFYKEQP